MAKRGRPKIDRPQVDLGTPELQRRRAALLGAPRLNWPAPDSSAVENALGVLLWQGVLHEDYNQAKKMHDAGVMFAGWWVLVYPKTFTQGTLGRLQPGGSTEVDVEEAVVNLRSAQAYLAKERRVLDAVINAAVFQRINLREMQKLRTGLCRLVEWKREQWRKKASTETGGERCV